MGSRRVRRKLSRSAEVYIKRLVVSNPRAAVLVSGAFLEVRLLTLLTDRISPNKKEDRRRVRKFLDDRFTIGPLLGLAKSAELLTSDESTAFPILLRERNDLAHKYQSWKKFGKMEIVAYRRQWKPVCESVLAFLERTK